MAYLPSELKRKSLNEQFRLIGDTLSSAKGGEVSPLISNYGFTPEKIAAEGEMLLATAKELHSKKEVEFAEKLASTQERDTLKEAAEDRVGTTWEIAKIALSHNAGLLSQLGINENRRHSISGWIGQSRWFYQHITSDVINLLTPFGYTAEKLLAESNMVTAVVEAEKRKNEEAGEAQRATIVRDEAVDALHGWLSTFYKISKMDLKNSPQLREELGLFERN